MVLALARARLGEAGDRSNRGTTLLSPGPPIYVFGSDGLRGARLDAARVAGFGARGVTVAAASPGEPWSAPRARTTRSAPSFASA